MPARPDDERSAPHGAAAPTLEGDHPLAHAARRLDEVDTPETNADALAVARELLQLLSHGAPFRELARGVVESIGRGLGWDLAALWVVDLNRQHIRSEAFWSAPGLHHHAFEAATRELTLARGDGIPGRVWQDAAPVWISDLVGDANFPRLGAAIADGVQTALAFPVVGDAGVVGVIELFARTRRDAEPSLLRALANIGAELGGFIQQRLEDELRQLNEYQLGLALEAAEMGIWRWEIRGNSVTWDRRMQAIFGMEEGEFDGAFETYASRLHPEDRESTLSQVRHAVDTGASYRVQHRVVWSDGTEHWVESVGRPLFTNGELTGMIGVSVDVTQRKAVEDAVNRLAAIVESTSDAIIGETLDGRITSWNPGAAKLFGYTAEEAIGRPVTMLCPPGFEDDLFDSLQQVASGVTIPHRETVRARRDGTLIDVALSLSPVRGPAHEVIGASVIARDITDRKQRELAAQQRTERLERLDELTTVLASAETPADVLDAVTTHVQAAVGASGGLVALLTDDGAFVEVAQAVGYDPALIESRRRLPLDAALPITDAIRRRAPIFQSGATAREEYPDAISLVQDATTAIAVLPLALENRSLGALGLTFQIEVTFDDDFRAILLDLANRCAVALGRARSFVREAAARARAEEVSRRLSFLSEAGAALAASLDVETTLNTVASLLVPRLADWCAVTLTSPRGEILARHPDPALAEAVVRLTTVTMEAPREARPGWSDVTARKSVFWPDVDPQLLTAHVDGTDAALIERLDLRSLIVVPLASRGSVVGALTLARSGTSDPYEQEDLQLAEELGRRAATAIENARLFSEQRHLAHTLQHNLLPHELPVIPGLELGARYNAAGHGTEVGGDFYDAFALDAQQWALVIGDVCGQGADAAGVTALARHTLRAITTAEREPSEILHRLNELLLAQDIGRRFITVALAIVKVDEAGVRLRISQGGHPDPIIGRADGTTELVSASRGTVLGVLAEPKLTSTSVRLGPGDTFVLYTDGVTEVRHDGDQFGVDRLREVVAASVGEHADAVAERIVEASIAFGGLDVTADDIAVFTACCVPSR